MTTSPSHADTVDSLFWGGPAPVRDLALQGDLSSPAMSDLCSNDGLRVFKSSIFPDVPLCTGRKGASWFLCFSRPVGARGTRIHACINQIDTSFPFPSELHEGHTKFVFNTHGPNHGILQQLLKVDGPPLLRKTGTEFGSGIEKLPEVEVLITPAETLRCCGRCNKWEAVHMPRFQVCSGCKLRYYCSKEVHSMDVLSQCW
jgi:hypothetical protein